MCVDSVGIKIWVLRMDGTIVLSTIDISSDGNMIFTHYSPFLCSPAAAMADPWNNSADRDIILWMPVVLS